LANDEGAAALSVKNQRFLPALPWGEPSGARCELSDKSEFGEVFPMKLRFVKALQRLFVLQKPARVRTIEIEQDLLAVSD